MRLGSFNKYLFPHIQKSRNWVMSILTPVHLFLLVMVIIIVLGAFLRFIDYASVPPFMDTADEFVYPLAGLSWIQTGAPIGWANGHVYNLARKIDIWGTWYPLVKPWLEKPPLYTMLTGGVLHILGARNFTDIRLETLRIIPIILSLFTIFLVGFLAKKIAGIGAGLLAAAVYATDPAIILSNRLSLTENLLEPLMLLAAIWIIDRQSLIENSRSSNGNIIVLSILSALSILTKQLGAAVPIAILIFLAAKRQWKAALSVIIASVSAGCIYLFLAFQYGWGTFYASMKQYSAHASGLPELVQSIFRYPIIVNRYELFPDGLILLGYILLFSAPWWMEKKYTSILFFPFTYLSLLAILESAHDSANFYGWHLYPFFPFLAILIALAAKELWRHDDGLQFWVFNLIIILSSVRFWLILYPQYQLYWQAVLGVTLLGILYWMIFHKRAAIILLGLIILVTNIAVTVNLDKVYGKKIQPAAEYVLPIQGLL